MRHSILCVITFFDKKDINGDSIVRNKYHVIENDKYLDAYINKLSKFLLGNREFKEMFGKGNGAVLTLKNLNSMILKEVDEDEVIILMNKKAE